MIILNSHQLSILNSTVTDQEKYITVESAAEMSGYNIQYLRRLLRAGKMERIKVGQMWLIQMDSLEDYLNSAGQKDDKRCGPKCPRINQSSTSVNTHCLHLYRPDE